MAIETLMLEQFRAVRADIAEVITIHDRQIAQLQDDVDRKRRRDLADADG